MSNYMKNNLQGAGVSLELPLFSRESEEDGVNCADLDTHLKFDSLDVFNTTIGDLTKMGPSLTS